VQTVLQTIGESQPAALKAGAIVDHSLLQKIERSGFVEKLYGGQSSKESENAYEAAIHIRTASWSAWRTGRS
jgi:hypothetical protein